MSHRIYYITLQYINLYLSLTLRPECTKKDGLSKPRCHVTASHLGNESAILFKFKRHLPEQSACAFDRDRDRDSGMSAVSDSEAQRAGYRYIGCTELLML